MKLYYATDSFKYEIEKFKMKVSSKGSNKNPLQDLQVYDSLGHLVPILSDLTLLVARFFTSLAQNNPMGISSGFAPVRENSLTQGKGVPKTPAHAR
jgi:hypothetical protein